MPSTTKTLTPNNAFRIVLDEKTLLPNNRSSADGSILGAQSFVEFSELPETLSYSKSANYNEDAVLGRSEPYQTYANSAAATFNFTAKLVATGSPKDQKLVTALLSGALGLTGRFVSSTTQVVGIAGNIVSNTPGIDTQSVVDTTFQEVTRKVAWLEALMYPQYDDQGITYAPPMVTLVYGQNFTRHGVITNINFTLKGPWETTTLLCMVVECVVQFTEVNKVPQGYLNVRNILKAKIQSDNTSGFRPRRVIDNVRSLSGL